MENKYIKAPFGGANVSVEDFFVDVLYDFKNVFTFTKALFFVGDNPYCAFIHDSNEVSVVPFDQVHANDVEKIKSAFLCMNCDDSCSFFGEFDEQEMKFSYYYKQI